MTSRERAEQAASEFFRLYAAGYEFSQKSVADAFQRAIDDACEAARDEEREACARLAEMGDDSNGIAFNIRARGAK
jgi:hypothetical protein